MNLFDWKDFVSTIKKHYIKILIVVFTILAISLGIHILGFNIFHSIGMRKRDLIEMINSYGRLAALVFISLHVVKTFFVVLPTTPLVILGGSIFGPIYGFIYSMIGAMISASLAFFIGRFAGRNVVQKLLGGRSAYLDDKVQNYGVRIIATIRVSFIVPFDVLSLGAGLTKMKYRDFIVGTFLGIVTEVFCLTYLGEKMLKPGSKGFYLSIGAVLLVLVVPMLISKYRNSKNNEL